MSSEIVALQRRAGRNQSAGLRFGCRTCALAGLWFGLTAAAFASQPQRPLPWNPPVEGKPKSAEKPDKPAGRPAEAAPAPLPKNALPATKGKPGPGTSPAGRTGHKPTPSGEIGTARVDRLIHNMREAQTRMESADTGLATQDLQARALQDLDKLLEDVKQAQSQPPPPAQQNPGSSNSSQSDSSASSQGSPSGTKSSSSAGTSAATPSRSETPQDSAERTDAALDKQVELSRRQHLAKDVWGHLPASMRDEMQNVYSEKYLPKYEDLVRRYYEALAEKHRRRSIGVK